jgi:glycerophosphoryl diester phosphodiesterase
MNGRPDTGKHGRPDTDTPGRIVAHRGACRVAPENTLAAFRAAAGQGARWIEFDVSLIGDETPVLHHDGTLDRCTDRSGPLAHLAASDLAGIDAGGWFGPAYAGEKLATLNEALALIGELELSANLEMKPHETPPEVIARAVAKELALWPWARRRIVVSSFDLPSLEALRRLMPDQPLAVLYEDPPADWPSALAALRASSLHVWRECITEEILARARTERVHVRVYTVNEPARMVRFRDAGLAGVITDHPPLYLDEPDWAAWSES